MEAKKENIIKRNDFRKLLKTYLAMTGTSITQMAEGADVRQRAVSNYINEENESELGSQKLACCLDFFAIDTDHYWRTVELAKKTAIRLRKCFGGGKDLGNINFGKNKLANLTDCPEINLFLDIKKEDLLHYFGEEKAKKIKEGQLLYEVAKAGIIDITSTYEYFKQLVNYFLNAQIKSEDDTLSSAEGAKAMNKIMEKAEQNKPGIGKVFSNVALASTKLGASPLFSVLPTVGSAILAAASIGIANFLSNDDDK